jgi:hypothetical protein
MAAIAEIEPDGEPAGMNRGGGSKNDGRRGFFGFSFHRQSRVTQLLTPGLCLLILSSMRRQSSYSLAAHDFISW